MQSTVEIRRARADDAPAIAACYRDAYRTAAELGYPSRMTEIDAKTVADWLAADAVTLVARPTDGDGSSTDGDGGGVDEDGDVGSTDEDGGLADEDGGESIDEDGGDGGAVDEDGGESVVGTVRMLEKRPAPYLERLAVAEAWQGRGLADRLVDRVETIAADRGYECIQLTAFDGHPFLFDWYASRGYEPIERHRRPERPYDFVTMERRFADD